MNEKSIPIYFVHAFTDKLFSGNPAAVCVLQNSIADELMQKITQENNLPLTVFLVPNMKDYDVRWLTPGYELELCGHGSLAAAFVIFNYLNRVEKTITLISRYEKLQISREQALFTLYFPIKRATISTDVFDNQTVGFHPIEVLAYKNERCLLVLEDEEQVKELKPDMSLLKKLPYLGITVTASSKTYDFVSRTFYPHKTINEDAVTGAAHCLLAPYWAARLNKTKFHAAQLSKRGGELFCEIQNDRVLISGTAILYLQGILTFA